jgi:hypothetical protein
MHPFIAEQLVADRRAQALADARHSRLVRAVAANRPGGARPRLGRQWRQRLGAGVLGLAAAIVALAAGPAESGPYPSTSRLRAEPITLVGLKATASEQVSYQPGASRTWSPGPEIVGVKVLSGRLSVYGADGERRVYIAGDGYAAGWAAYSTVNETDELVETLVTNHVKP